MKKLLLLATLILFSTSVISCSNKTNDNSSTSIRTDSGIDNTNPATSSSQNEETSQTFTLEDLKQYNGQDGNPAYVAVDGIVYDVTNANEWENGNHFSGIVAGQDLTDELARSPHGDSVLNNLPVVGTIEP